MADKKRTPPKRKERTEEVRDDGQKPEENGEVPSDSAAAAAVENSENGTLQYEPMELPPFEVITGYVSADSGLCLSTVEKISDRCACWLKGER